MTTNRELREELMSLDLLIKVYEKQIETFKIKRDFFIKVIEARNKEDNTIVEVES